MPEEINRILTDQIADYLFTPSRDGDANLAHEGIDPKRVFFVGNVMIDTLIRLLAKTDPRARRAARGVKPGHYALATLHRPSNVDDPDTLTRDHEGDGGGREAAAGGVPGASAHARTHQRVWASRSLSGDCEADRARGVSRFPRSSRASRRSCSPIPVACRRRRRSSAFPCLTLRRIRSVR